MARNSGSSMGPRKRGITVRFFGDVDRLESAAVIVRVAQRELLPALNPILIGMGFADALEHEFDWTRVFDADSVPAPDALEDLLAFFERSCLLEAQQTMPLYPSRACSSPHPHV